MILLLCISIAFSHYTEKGLEYFQIKHDRVLAEAAIKEESKKEKNAIETPAAEQNDVSESSAPPAEITQSSIENNEASLKSRSEIKGRTIDQISSGRTTIWRSEERRVGKECRL